MTGVGFPKEFAEVLVTNSGLCACFLDHEKVGDSVSPSLCKFEFLPQKSKL